MSPSLLRRAARALAPGPLALALLAPCPLAGSRPAASQEPAALPEHPDQIPLPPLPAWSPPRPSEHSLISGARVLLLSDHGLPLVEGRLRFRAGSIHEPEEALGTAAVLADVLRGGGGGGPLGLGGPELDAWLDARGAELAIGAGLDEISVSFSCLREDLPRLLELVAALLLEPLYPAGEVERAVLRLRTEIARRDDDSGQIAERLLRELVHGADSPFARVPTQETAARIDRDALLAYHRAHLGADRLLIGLAGDVALGEALPLLEDAFERLPAAGPPPEVPARTFRQPARTTIYVQDRPAVPQTQVRMAAPGVRLSDEDAPALRLFTLAVGAGGFTNRMMLRVRTELGLAYGVGAAFSPGFERRGTFQAFCATRNEAVAEAVEAMLGVLAGGLEPLPADELDAARARETQLRLRELRDTPAILERALTLAFHGYPPGFWEGFARGVRDVGPEQVAEAAARQLDLGRLVIVAVGPAAEIAPALSALAPVERLDLPGNRDGMDGGGGTDVEARVEKLLSALGGREAWARARYLEVHARIVSRMPELEHRSEARTWHDLDVPRLRALHRSDGTDTTMVVTPDLGLTRSADTVQELPEPVHEELLRLARRDVFRLVHLLAAGRAEARALGEGGLVLSAEPGIELELELDERGLPRSARAVEHGREVHYRFEGWTALEGGLRHPARIHKDGPEPWTRELFRFQVHPRLEPGLFERP